MAVWLFDDPIVIGLLVILLTLIIFGYLLMRRTVLSLREGYEEGQRRK